MITFQHNTMMARTVIHDVRNGESLRRVLRVGRKLHPQLLAVGRNGARSVDGLTRLVRDHRILRSCN